MKYQFRLCSSSLKEKFTIFLVAFLQKLKAIQIVSFKKILFYRNMKIL